MEDDNTGKRNLVDYLEFISKFRTVNEATKNELIYEFPEFFNVAINQEKAIELYHRIAQQSYQVFEKYPKVKKLI